MKDWLVQAKEDFDKKQLVNSEVEKEIKARTTAILNYYSALEIKRPLKPKDIELAILNSQEKEKK